ncbi:hypothetical protein [Acidiferrobacter thiooxydans]
MVPAHRRDLPATHGGFDRPGDEGAGLAPVGVGGGQEAREFVADQAAVAAAGELGALAPDKFHGVTQGLHTPGGAGDVEEVGK